MFFMKIAMIEWVVMPVIFLVIAAIGFVGMLWIVGRVIVKEIWLCLSNMCRIG